MDIEEHRIIAKMLTDINHRLGIYIKTSRAGSKVHIKAERAKVAMTSLRKFMSQAAFAEHKEKMPTAYFTNKHHG